jgi:hypothetical protein
MSSDQVETLGTIPRHISLYLSSVYDERNFTWEEQTNSQSDKEGLMPEKRNSETHVITVDATNISKSKHFGITDEKGRKASRLKVKTGQKVAWQLRDGNVADASKVHLFILFPRKNSPFNGASVFHTTGAKAGECQPTTAAGRVRRLHGAPVDFDYYVAVIDETNSAKPIAHAEDPVIQHSGSGAAN